MQDNFYIAEAGAGSYWMLSILRWVMVVIFVAFGMQKFTPQSAHGIELYISNSPFVSWLSIFGVRGEADLLGVIELTTAALLAAGAFSPIASAVGATDGNRNVLYYLVILLLDSWRDKVEPFHGSNGVESRRRILIQRYCSTVCMHRIVSCFSAEKVCSVSVAVIKQGLSRKTVQRHFARMLHAVSSLLVGPSADWVSNRPATGYALMIEVLKFAKFPGSSDWDL